MSPEPPMPISDEVRAQIIADLLASAGRKCPDACTYKRFAKNMETSAKHNANIVTETISKVFKIVDTIPDFNRQDFKLYVREQILKESILSKKIPSS